jgi:hypothetical protein
MLSLMSWGDRWMSAGGAAPVALRHSCGHVGRPSLTCSACGEAVEPQAMTRASGDQPTASIGSTQRTRRQGKPDS